MSLPALRLLNRERHASFDGETTTELDSEGLFRKYAADVASLGLAMLGNSDEADDLVQDVFLRAFRAMGSVRDPERIRAWLMTIAVRQGRTRLRKRKLSRLWFASTDFDFEQLAAPGSTAEEKVQIARLFGVLEGMNVDLRIAWVLHYLQSETCESVAEHCAWSVTTAKRRIREAHQQVVKGMGA